jgi:precorrin-3B synthase
MNAPLIRGACPALSAPMPTGDGLLIRLSPASGGFSPKQLIGLCQSASRNGNGIVEVTARGSCQFRGFSTASAERFAEDVDTLAVAVRTGVPVEVSPLAGMDPQEIGDAAALARLIRDGIEASGLSGRLGPKVSVVVDGGGQVCLDDIAADIRLTAALVDGSVLWRVAIAGNAETATQLGWYEGDGGVGAALSVLAAIAERGRDTRARDVVSEVAVNQPRSFAPPSVLPDISPSRGEIAPAACVSPIAGIAGGTAAPKLPISPLEGEMSGRTEGDAKERGPEMANKAPLAAQTSHSDFDTYRLHADRHALPISLPFGHLDAAALIDLTLRAEALGVADIRPAQHRTLLSICSSLEAAQALREHAAKLGLITASTDPRKNIAACSGAPACASGTIAARDIAEELARSLGNAGAQNLSIHISGCQKGCARQAAADVTIVGGENGAGLVVHGTTRSKPLAYRSAGGLAKAIAAVAAKLQAEPQITTAKVAGKPAKTLSPAQLACLKAAFEQDGP